MALLLSNIGCNEGDSPTESDSNNIMCSSNSEHESNSNPVRAVLITSEEQGPAEALLGLQVDTSGHAMAPSCVPQDRVGTKITIDTLFSHKCHQTF